MAQTICLVAGVPIEEILTVRTDQATRTLYDPDTGVPKQIDFVQTMYKICGVDLELVEKKKLKRELYDDENFYGYDITAEFRRWLDAYGFCPKFLVYSQSIYDHFGPFGILGLSVWDYNGDQLGDNNCDNYGYLSPYFDHAQGKYCVSREIEPQQVGKRLIEVKEKLDKIGCKVEPRIHVCSFP